MENMPAWIISEIFQAITLIKIGTAVSMVVALSFLAERISPRFAGIVAGYPLGAAITLFFCGLEVGPAFAAESAIYTIFGLIATQAFVYFYYLGSRLSSNMGKYGNLAASSVIGLAGYFAAAFMLRPFHVGRLAAIVAAGVSIYLSGRIFERIENTLIAQKAKINIKLLLIRAGIAASIIIFITSAAGAIGPRWVGLLAAFPITIFPLLLIIHATYKKENVYTIIKNVPRGLGSLATYSLIVSAAYPAMGIYWGTLTAYAAATVYLVLINGFKG